MVAAAADPVGRADLLADLGARLRRPGPVTVLLIGEPGIGKTTLWSAALGKVDADWRWSTRCLQAEAGLGLAALADLFATVPDDVLEALPAPQRRAVDTVLFRGVESTAATGESLGNRLLGASTLSVLQALAARGRVLLGVDDLQWCDPGSLAAMSFALHRLVAEPVSVLADRRADSDVELPGGERVVLTPLDDSATRAVVRGELPDAPPRLVARLALASGGSPFFAVELARSVRAGADPDRLPVSLRDAIGRRLEELPDTTRRTLLDVAVRGAPEVAELDLESLDPAFRADVVTLDQATVRFTHPLLAGGSREGATPAQLRAAHAGAARAARDPVQRALHRAAAEPPSEDLAAALDAAVPVAAARGDLEGAAAVARLALERTPGGARPVVRLVTLAEREKELTRHAVAAELAREALERADEPVLRARAVMARADSWDDHVAVADMLLGAATEAQVPVDLGRIMLSYAAMRLMIANRFDRAAGVLDQALRVTPDLSPSWVSLIAHQTLLDRTLGRPVDRGKLDRAIALDRRGKADLAGTALLAGGVIAFFDDRHEDARELFAAAATAAAAHGETMASTYPALLRARCGDLAAADDLLSDLCAQAEGDLLGLRLMRLAHVRAWRGDDLGVQRILADTADNAQAYERAFVRGFGDLLAGRAAQAWPALRDSNEHLRTIGQREPSHPAVLPAAVEAALAAGEAAEAEVLCRRLEQDSEAVPSPWGRAAAVRCRAFIAQAGGHDRHAIELFERAGAAFDDLGVPLEAARSWLAAGALARRLGERRHARKLLDQARDTFARCGALALLGDTEAELGRIGGRVAAAGLALTETERQVAQLVALGRRNAEVAAALHVSVKTVEAHLGRTFRKLGVSNRTELAHAIEQHTKD